MQQTVLVAVDIANAEPAMSMIETARRFGGQDVRIVLLNVVEHLPAYVAAQLPAGTMKKAEENAYAALKALAEKAGGHVEADVRTGNAATEILNEARERGADLIMVASHRPGLADYFLGSTAARVVRHADCSVYVAR